MVMNVKFISSDQNPVCFTLTFIFTQSKVHSLTSRSKVSWSVSVILSFFACKSFVLQVFMCVCFCSDPLQFDLK